MSYQDDAIYSNDFVTIEVPSQEQPSHSRSLNSDMDTEASQSFSLRRSINLTGDEENDQKVKHLKELHSKRENRWANEKEKILGEKNELKTQLDIAQKSATDAEGKCAIAEAQYKELLSQYNCVKESETNLKGQNESLQTQFEKVCSEHEKLKDVARIAVQETEAKHANVEEQSKGLEKENNEMKSENEELKVEIEKLQNQNAKLQKDLEDTTKLYQEVDVEGKKQSEADKTTLDEAGKQVTKLSEIVEEKTREMEQLSAELKKVTGAYKELRDIVNLFEDEQGQLKTELGKKAEHIKNLEEVNNNLREQLEEEKKEHRKLQEDRDNFDDKLIQERLKYSSLEKNLAEREQRENDEGKIKSLNQKLRILTEENERMNEVKDESRKINEAMEALNQETNVLRSRLEQTELENSALESNKVKHQEEKDGLTKEINRLKTELRKIPGQPPSRPSPPNPRVNTTPPSRSSPSNPWINSTSRTNNVDSRNESIYQSFPSSREQWYNTDNGEKILHEIYKQLKEPLTSSSSLVELSRDVNSKDITMIVTRDGTRFAALMFPWDFPNSALQLHQGQRKSKLEFPYSTNSSPTEFATKVVSRVIGIILN